MPVGVCVYLSLCDWVCECMCMYVCVCLCVFVCARVCSFILWFPAFPNSHQSGSLFQLGILGERRDWCEACPSFSSVTKVFDTERKAAFRRTTLCPSTGISSAGYRWPASLRLCPPSPVSIFSLLSKKSILVLTGVTGKG